ncbi:cyclopropane fatty acyl phospholipid synthase [Leptospira koniambonensis]|uniref:Cyclopropane fatty acyl phospholipid synthase n=1 Tax=Leptospira koniambonensis TaxID=2484950 RepID=A0A4R9JC07_9LEPT|nr:cyclopropane fatty acyl phospholipid synthase [Leptospira koniambonensis]TGL35451.1 cyclopropane fatty acyl phospholipid synthase [Leptospira koniambonensis]
MWKEKVRGKVEELFAKAGVSFGGNADWDIQVKDDRLFEKIFSNGSLGLGEAYMNGWFECGRFDETVRRLLDKGIEKAAKTWGNFFLYIESIILNRQSKRRAFMIGERHYDLGNDLFELMLDKEMVYSCAYWKNTNSLDQAQENKMDLICRKLDLQPGMKVLDIGCGWGGLARHAAREYGAEVFGISVSKEQLALAEDRSKNLNIKYELMDYRDVKDNFDSILSVGQMEHVGYKNYRTYMEIVYKSLKEKGLFLLHTIGSNNSSKMTDRWIEKYIFPNSHLPSAAQITKASENLFVLEDLHNFGPDYDKTLMAWYNNFEKGWNLIQKKYGERFKRMWEFYLLSCAGAFRSRKIQLWQFVFSKGDREEIYQAIR